MPILEVSQELLGWHPELWAGDRAQLGFGVLGGISSLGDSVILGGAADPGAAEFHRHLRGFGGS